MTRADLLQFMRAHRYAVQASVSAAGLPQAALVGIAVTDRFEIVFDTVETSRKAANLAGTSSVAFVIGGTNDDAERSVQYEGVVDRPAGTALLQAQEAYFARFPDGRERLQWPGLIHLRATATWIRYSDFSVDPPRVVELDAAALTRLI